MPNRFANPRPQFMNATPVVYAAGVLRFYASGTSTPLNVYSGSDLTGASTTITLNSAGRPSQDIFLSNVLYKVTLEDSLGNLIWSVDPYMTSDYTTTAKVTGYSGNPNTHVAGTASSGSVPADAVWDRTNHVLYVCTTTGNAAAAVWTVANVTALSTWTTGGRNVSPVEGVDFGYNTTLHALEYWNASAWFTLGRAPTVQKFTSGTSQTYTPATGMVRIRGRISGPGGGGGGATANNGANGSADTSFGDWVAGLGGAGGGNAGVGGGGGGPTTGTGTLIVGINGGTGIGGQSTTTASTILTGGSGGSNPFGGAGAGTTVATGGDAKANTGGGGAGGGGGSATATGGGGGAGGYVEFWMTAAQVGASKTYTVGAGGAGGAAGTRAGGVGAAGIIIIEEFYS